MSPFAFNSFGRRDYTESWGSEIKVHQFGPGVDTVMHAYICILGGTFIFRISWLINELASSSTDDLSHVQFNIDQFHLSIHNWWFIHDLRLMNALLNNLWISRLLLVNDAWLKARGSKLMAHGSWPRGLGAAQVPPWALSHEALTINKRLDW